MKNKFCTKTTIHKKGWGYEEWVVNNHLYCGKILHFEKNKKCSIHFHKSKTETFHILKGSILLRWLPAIDATKHSDEYLMSFWKVNYIEFEMNEGDTLDIPSGRLHQVFALTDEVDILEVSTQHFDEDSYRILKGD